MTEKYSKITLVVKDQKCFNPNVGGGVGGGNLTPSWFPLNNLRTVKAVSLEFCSIHSLTFY